MLDSSKLREYLPLKQGLRLTTINSWYIFPNAQRVSSIKTRIKTIITLPNPLSIRPQRVSSIKTRIKT